MYSIQNKQNKGTFRFQIFKDPNTLPKSLNINIQMLQSITNVTMIYYF